MPRQLSWQERNRQSRLGLFDEPAAAKTISQCKENPAEEASVEQIKGTDQDQDAIGAAYIRARKDFGLELDDIVEFVDGPSGESITGQIVSILPDPFRIEIHTNGGTRKFELQVNPADGELEIAHRSWVETVSWVETIPPPEDLTKHALDALGDHLEEQERSQEQQWDENERRGLGRYSGKPLPNVWHVGDRVNLAGKICTVIGPGPRGGYGHAQVRTPEGTEYEGYVRDCENLGPEFPEVQEEQELPTGFIAWVDVEGAPEGWRLAEDGVQGFVWRQRGEHVSGSPRFHYGSGSHETREECLANAVDVAHRLLRGEYSDNIDTGTHPIGRSTLEQVARVCRKYNWDPKEYRKPVKDTGLDGWLSYLRNPKVIQQLPESLRPPPPSRSKVSSPHEERKMDALEQLARETGNDRVRFEPRVYRKADLRRVAVTAAALLNAYHERLGGVYPEKDNAAVGRIGNEIHSFREALRDCGEHSKAADAPYILTTARCYAVQTEEGDIPSSIPTPPSKPASSTEPSSSNAPMPTSTEPSSTTSAPAPPDTATEPGTMDSDPIPSTRATTTPTRQPIDDLQDERDSALLGMNVPEPLDADLRADVELHDMPESEAIVEQARRLDDEEDDDFVIAL